MSLQSILNQVADFRDDMKNQDRVVVNNTIAALRKVARKQALKRDQYAVNAMLDAMIHKLNSCDLTLAYEYQGTLYAVHKDYRDECRGGVFSTEILHGKNLTMAEWDALPKFNVWVSTGKVYAPCL